jgi:ribosomal protein L11 methylase PrmA
LPGKTSGLADVHLDYGCCDGMFLSSLKKKGVEQLYGVDISEIAVNLAQPAASEDVEFPLPCRQTK